jgi:hypothetical protein
MSLGAETADDDDRRGASRTFMAESKLASSLRLQHTGVLAASGSAAASASTRGSVLTPPTTLAFTSWWNEATPMGKELGTAVSALRHVVIELRFNTVDNSCEVRCRV